MDNFVFITDTHLYDANISSRSDNYNQSIMEKIKFVFEYCKNNNIGCIVHGGDLTHTHKPSPQLLLDFVDLIMQYGINLYYVYGNHEVQGANHNHIDKTNLGFLSRYNWFHEINNNVVELNNCVLTGYNYTSEKLKTDFLYPESYRGNKKKVLVLHANIYSEESLNKNLHIGIGTNDVITDADLVLCGHNHLGFKHAVKNNGSVLINPGSVARTSIDQHINGYGPRLVHITIGKNIKYKFVDIPCKDVFNLKKYNNKKILVDSQNKFINKLKNIRYSDVNCVKKFSNLLSNPPDELKNILEPEIIEICKEYLIKGSE